jgi:hypothetical protein
MASPPGLERAPQRQRPAGPRRRDAASIWESSWAWGRGKVDSDRRAIRARRAIIPCLARTLHPIPRRGISGARRHWVGCRASSLQGTAHSGEYGPVSIAPSGGNRPWRQESSRSWTSAVHAAVGRIWKRSRPWASMTAANPTDLRAAPAAPGPNHSRRPPPPSRPRREPPRRERRSSSRSRGSSHHSRRAGPAQPTPPRSGPCDRARPAR